ncbi:hypothetical protein EYC84_002058 [Monilinia fructicola]|uniref:Uncharacterized protein n=1 Tax=Monilinia fructicola TaxID=38448 RepID=A0A5M9JUL1_MONFR|nr:hypothetical protein EYC84_002058 [Monilinia fructicola]
MKGTRSGNPFDRPYSLSPPITLKRRTKLFVHPFTSHFSPPIIFIYHTRPCTSHVTSTLKTFLSIFISYMLPLLANMHASVFHPMPISNHKPVKTNSRNNRQDEIRKLENTFINITHTSHTIIISRHLHFLKEKKRKIKKLSQSAFGRKCKGNAKEMQRKFKGNDMKSPSLNQIQRNRSLVRMK